MRAAWHYARYVALCALPSYDVGHTRASFLWHKSWAPILKNDYIYACIPCRLPTTKHLVRFRGTKESHLEGIKFTNYYVYAHAYFTPHWYETHTEKLNKKEIQTDEGVWTSRTLAMLQLLHALLQLCCSCFMLRRADLTNSRYLVSFDKCRLICWPISILSAVFSEALNNSRHHLATLPVSTNVD
jgi:hypothetical protein